MNACVDSFPNLVGWVNSLELPACASCALENAGYIGSPTLCGSLLANVREVIYLMGNSHTFLSDILD